MAVTDKGHHKGRIAPNRGRTFPPEVLTEDEVRQLIHARTVPRPVAATVR